MEQDLKRFFGQVDGPAAATEQSLVRLQPIIPEEIPFVKLTYHHPPNLPNDFRLISYFLPDLGGGGRVVSPRPKNAAGKGDAGFYHHPMTTIKRRRVEITVFDQERVSRQSVTAHCPVCRLHSEMLTPEQAGDLARVGVQSIHLWLVQGKAHGVKMLGGQERVCKNSLLQNGEG
jgi:hypothetical protein